MPLKQPTRKQMIDLTNAVLAFLGDFDATMKQPESADRGKLLASLINRLEYANDMARYFALGVDHKTDKKRPLKR